MSTAIVTPHVRKEISGEICHKAIDLMFPDLPTCSAKRDKLITFIKERFGNLDCCVLYQKSKNFNELCNKLSLDPGTKEVIILGDYSVFYSANYHVPPLPISC